MRLFNAVALAVWLFYAAPLAIAQSTSQDRLEEAVSHAQRGDLDAASEAAERAFAIAETIEDEFWALNLLSDIRFNQERWREAAQLSAEAVAILDEHFPESAQALDILLSRQFGALFSAGDVEAAFALHARMMEINRTDNEALWRYEADGARHRLTGYPCEQGRELTVLYDLTVYEVIGTDIACQYVLVDNPTGVITIHVSADGNTTHERAFAMAADAVNQAWRGPAVIDEGQRTIADTPVQYRIYGAGTRRTGVWTTIAPDWVLKLRMTHDGELSLDEMQAVATEVFSRHPAMVDHLDRCNRLDGAAELTQDPDPVTTGLMASLFGAVARDTETAQNDLLQCHISDITLDGEGIILAEIDEAGNPVRFVARSARSENRRIIAAPSATLGLAQSEISGTTPATPYVLTLETPDRITVYGQFDGPPSPLGFAQAVNAILNDRLEPLSAVTTDDAGNNSIQIMMDMLDEQAAPTKD